MPSFTVRHLAGSSCEVDDAGRRGCRGRLERAQVAGGLGLLEVAEAEGAGRGSAISCGSSPTTWTNTIGARARPCGAGPVEWRNRGPKPRLTATRSRSRSATRAASSTCGLVVARDRRTPGGRGGRRAAPGRGGRRAAASATSAPPSASTSLVAALAAATSGWSKGCTPRAAPTRAVASSHGDDQWPIPCGARRRSGRRRRGARRPASVVESGTLRRGRGGRRRRRRARRAARRRSGTTPVPSLPSDSATSCSSQSPSVVERRGRGRR